MGAAFVGFFVEIGFSASAAAVASQIVTTILLNVALTKVSKLLARKPRVEVPPINVTVRNAIENRRILFGSGRAGGTFVFYDISGGSTAGSLWYVIAYAGHQIQAFRGVWLDTHFVPASEINGGNAAGGAVTTGDYANVLWIYKHLGTSAQTSDTDLTAAGASFPPPAEWTSDHRLLGTAYLVVRMKRDDAKFPTGAPQSVTVEYDGARLYDSRLDSTVPGGSGSHRKTDPSTWEWGTDGAIGRNPVLQWRWYVSGGSVHNDITSRLIKYGLRVADSRIPDSYVIAAANVCDEVLSGANAPPSGNQVRYRCDLEVSTGETRRDIVEDILASMAGEHVIVRGEHRIYAGDYETPLHAFTEADLYGSLEVEDTVDHKRRYNAVAGVFRDASKQYVEQTTLFRMDSAYETQDGGRRIPLEIDLRGVTDQYQAQRLCEIKLRQSRMMRSVRLVGALNLLKVANHEGLTLSATPAAWTSRIFRCKERQFEFLEAAGRVALTCLRDDPGVWADLLTADYETSTSPTDVFTSDTPAAPTGLATTSLPGAVLVSVTLPATITPGSVVEIWEYTANTPFSSATKIAEGRGNIFSVSHRDTTTRYYWATITDARKARSTEFPSGNGTAGTPDRVQTVDINPDAATEVLSATDTGPDSFGFGSTLATVISITFTPPVDGTLILTATFDYTGFDGDAGHQKGLFRTQNSVTVAGQGAAGAGDQARQALSDTFAVVAGLSVTCGLRCTNGLSSSTMVFENMSLVAEMIKR